MRILVYILLSLTALSGVAQDVSISASVRGREYSTDDQIRLEIKYNANGKYQAPELSDFHVSGGREYSSGSYVQINGRVIENNMTYTRVYALQPKKAGKLTIGSAKLTVDGKEYQTVPIALEIKKGNSPAAGGTFDPSKALIAKVYASKQEVYEGEALTLVYKMYSPFHFRQLTNFEIPSYPGFWKTSLGDQKNQSYNVSQERINGRNYQVVTLEKELLIAQQTGEITIEPFEIEALIQNGWQMGRDNAKSNRLTIKVKPLPEQGKPNNFTGAVGKFQISATANDLEITEEDDGLDVTVKITGKGNIKFIDDPLIEFPDEFDTYPPEADRKSSTSLSGMNGENVYNYFTLPLMNGTFELGPFEFPYFDPDSETYKMAKTETLKITVNKPDLADRIRKSPDKKLTPKGVKELRYIHTASNPEKFDGYLIESPLFWTGIAVPPLALLLLLVFKRESDEISEEEKQSRRAKAASRLALLRLKDAKLKLDEGDLNTFFDENLKSLLTYLGDKFVMEVSDLNKSRIREELTNRNVSSETSQKLLDLLEQCEMARYASLNQDARSIYTDSLTVIEEIEKQTS